MALQFIVRGCTVECPVYGIFTVKCSIDGMFTVKYSIDGLFTMRILKFYRLQSGFADASLKPTFIFHYIMLYALTAVLWGY